jgi:hypothetical protein
MANRHWLRTCAKRAAQLLAGPFACLAICCGTGLVERGLSPAIIISQASAQSTPCPSTEIRASGGYTEDRLFRSPHAPAAIGDVASVEVLSCKHAGDAKAVASQGAGTEELIPGGEDEWGSPHRYVFWVLPCRLPNGSDVPGATVTVTFTGEDPPAKQTKTFPLADDTEPPSLDVHSDPPKGRKVRPGQKIDVKMTADENYNDTDHTGWQTGVRTIQLLADDGKVEPDFTEPGMVPKACAEKSWKRRLEVTYTVPNNPPPVVHLTAIASDYAGKDNSKDAEFPTDGEWYGTLKGHG